MYLLVALLPVSSSLYNGSMSPGVFHHFASLHRIQEQGISNIWITDIVQLHGTKQSNTVRINNYEICE